MTTPFTLTRTYDNGATRSMTVTAISLSGDTAVITTTEDGDVAISLQDTPDIWAQLMAEVP